MPQVILTRNALNDLSRLKVFLQTKNPEAAKEAVITIRSHLKELATTPLAKAAITSFIEQEERIEAERREAIASYEDYLETGLHVTRAKVS